jgi:hypothetical protein
MTPEKTKKVLVFIVIFILLSGVVLVGSFALKMYLKNVEIAKITEFKQKETERIKKQETLLKQNDVSLKNFSANQTEENQKMFITEVNTLLSEETTTLDSYGQSILLLRKAIVLTTLIRDKQINYQNNYSEQLKEAFSIYKNFITTTEKTPLKEYTRDFSLVAVSNLITNMHIQCCFDKTLAQNFIAETSPSFSSYKNKGYDTDMSTLLALDDLLLTLSEKRRNDAAGAAQSYIIKSYILGFRDEDLKEEDKRTLTEKLKRDLDSFPTLQAHTFKDPGLSKVEPSHHYATAFDVYQNITNNKTASSSLLIDKNYEDTLKLLKEQVGVMSDENIYASSFFTYLSYIDSLHTRYGKTSPQVTVAVKDFITLINKSETIKKSSEQYFKMAVTDQYIGKSLVNRMIDLSSKQKNLENYFISIGLK